MPFKPEDFKDHYVFAGRKYDPKDKSLLGDYFSRIYSNSVDTDGVAITKADIDFCCELGFAKVGEVVDATLHFNDCIVKNYPEVVKQ